MAQQTAMQKLLTNLESIGITIPQGVEMVYLKIEKEQILEAYFEGYTYGGHEVEFNGEQYYKETYSK